MPRIPFPLLLLLGASLAAQGSDPRVSLGLNLSFPTGGFYKSTYGPTSEVLSPQTETYDMGAGAQIGLTYPLDRHVAFRGVLAGQFHGGKNTAPGYENINLEHSMVSLGAEIHIYPESALRLRGPYFFGGVSADFERFDRSFGDVDWDYTDTTHKSRLGGTLGLGHSFPMGGSSRWYLEAAYHTSLTGKDAAAGDPPATSFLRFAVGWVF